jgi:hypothetical protein
VRVQEEKRKSMLSTENVNRKEHILKSNRKKQMCELDVSPMMTRNNDDAE